MKGFLNILQSQAVFAIHPQIGVNMLMYALMVAKRKETFSQDAFDLKQSVGYGVEVTNQKGQSVGEVYVQQIHGTLFAQDQFCGPKGTNSLARKFEQLAEKSKYDAVVLDIQSPGGQVIGTEGLANAITYLRERKPVVAFVNGLAASAGYRLAIEADEIFLDGNTTEVGSIGVMLHYLDFSEFMRKEGISEVKIMSSLSPDKNKFNYSEPSEEDVHLIQSDMLDPLANEFQAAVRARRADISAAALTGNMFLAEEAISLGMADRIGTYVQAIERAYELSQNSSNDMGIFTKEEKTENAGLTQQEHDAAIQTLKDEHATEMEQAKEANQQEVDRLQTTIDNLNATIAQQKVRIEELSKQPSNEVKDPEGDEGIPSADTIATKTAPTHKYGGFGEDRKNEVLGPLQ